MKKILLTFGLVLLTLCFISCDTEDECDHKNLRETVKQSTCTEGGYTEYFCEDCEYSYKALFSDPKGHDLNKTVTPPTCTKSGFTTYSCECGESFISDNTDALGHDYSFTVTPPTCENNGYTTFKCNRCNSSYTSGYTAALGHAFTEKVTSPSCTEQGYTTYSCACGFTYISAYTEPTSHTFTNETTPPTCTDGGYTTYLCECGYSYKSDFTKPIGHKYTSETVSEADCTKTGEIKYTCSCSDSYTITVAPFGHDFSRSVVMPTLSDMGYTVFSCPDCGYSYTGEYTFYSDILKDAYADNNEIIAKGIDVSYHNYKVNGNGEYISLDWEAIKASGVSYVIIRIGDAAIGIDPTFEKSYEEAKAAGLDVGFYFYTRATSVSEITLEANLVLSALKDKQFEYPVYLDLEDESLLGIDPSILNQMCVEFFTILQRSGYYTGLYVNDEWIYNVIDTETALSRFEIWYARFPSFSEGEIPTWNEDEFGQTLGMWQYSYKGQIDGIDHTVFDFNYSYKDYPTIVKEYGFNGYDGDFSFPDTGKSFVWVVYETASIKIRSKSDYFTADEYDGEADVIGYAKYGTRFEVVEATEQYTAIKYDGKIAYISANPAYVSFDGIYIK